MEVFGLHFKTFYMTHSDRLGNPLFALFCANMQYFWPSLPVSSYRQLYEDLELRQSSLFSDQQLEDLCTHTTLSCQERNRLEHISQKQGFILTFHTGAYRALPRILCELGFNIALLASSSVRDEQMGILEAQHAAIRQHKSNTGRFIILDAEQGGSLLQVRKALRDGYHILVYVDGNTGCRAPHKESGHSLQIPFLRRAIFQRTAITSLSYRWQLPIYSILSTKRDGHISFSLGDPIRLSSYQNALTYSREVYTRLYSYLGQLIRDDPMTWEGWRYVWQRSGSGRHIWRRCIARIYRKRLWPVYMQGRYYALNSEFMCSYMIDYDVYNKLCRLKSKELA